MFANFLSSIDGFEDQVFTFFSHIFFLAPILLLILEESGVPFPFADFVIAYTGYQVSLGRIPYFVAYFILLVADLLGASILYFLSRKYGKRIIFTLGKFIDLDHNKLATVEDKFRKYGPIVIIVGRHVIGFKIPVTIFSGISKIPYPVFLLCTFISVIWWIPIYLSLGQKLGPKTVHLFHTHHGYYLLILLPILISLAPFFFLRKKK